MASTTNPEQDPAPRPKRQTFPAEYKLRIVAEYDAERIMRQMQGRALIPLLRRRILHQ
ncbi:hypothetical protein [Kitasatospora cinereorecta]|uniref:Transposase n=1 Tax=Kitasatospora cinereorecta TaxID=285560 RepID=A0ABW0VGM7_9ACTN